MLKHIFSGKNLDDALAKAAEVLKIDKTFLNYTVVKNEKENFFTKFFNKTVSIEVWFDNTPVDLQLAARKVVTETLFKKEKEKRGIGIDHQDMSQALPSKEINQPTHSNSKEDRSESQYLSFQSEDVKKIADEFLGKFMTVFSLSPENITIKAKNNSDHHATVIEINDEFIDDLLSKSDKISIAFDHILKRLVHKKLNTLPEKVIINTPSAHSKRKDYLEQMAKSLGEKVRKTGKTITLSSKTSFERRIIHTTLENFSGVATKSVGTGDQRQLIIYPLEKKKKSGDNHAAFKNSTNGKKSNRKKPHFNKPVKHHGHEKTEEKENLSL